MFTKKLKELKENNQIASFYTNADDTTRFLVGYVLYYNNDYFVVSAISPHGLYDGIVLDETNSIVRINVGSKYEHKIKILEDYQKTICENVEFETNDLVFEVLKYAKINNYITSIELVNCGFYDIRGYVEEVVNDSCSIKEVTEYGDANGVTLIELSDITKISCNSSEEVVLKILNCANGI